MSILARHFKEREDRSVVELVQETIRVSVLASSVSGILAKRKAAARKRDEAQKAMATLVNAVARREEPEEEVSPSFLKRWAYKILKFAGRRVLKAVVKPILRFAGRVAMTLIRFAARTLVRFIIVPVIQLAAALVVANPITAAIAGLALAAGGGYWLWQKFFKEPAIKPKVMTAEAVDTTDVALEDYDIEAVPSVAEAVPGEAPQAEAKTSITDYIAAPIQAVKSLVQTKKEKTGGKFKGFGSDVDAYIKEASQRYPILSEDVLRGFIKMEGGWTGAMSPTGAIGTGQFIKRTWDDLAATSEGKALGMTAIGTRFRTPEDPRFDKRINTLATGLLASQNAKMLKARGLPITGENLYMLHNIGPGILDVMLGKPASAATLKAMQQNGMLKGQSASDFLVYQKGRFNTAYEQANTTTGVQTNMPQLAEGKVVDKPQPKVAVSQPKQAQPVLASNSGSRGTDLVRGPGNSIVKV